MKKRSFRTHRTVCIDSYKCNDRRTRSCIIPKGASLRSEALKRQRETRTSEGDNPGPRPGLAVRPPDDRWVEAQRCDRRSPPSWLSKAPRDPRSGRKARVIHRWQRRPDAPIYYYMHARTHWGADRRELRSARVGQQSESYDPPFESGSSPERPAPVPPPRQPFVVSTRSRVGRELIAAKADYVPIR